MNGSLGRTWVRRILNSKRYQLAHQGAPYAPVGHLT